MSAPPVDPGAPLVVVLLRITDLRPGVDPLTGSVRRDPWSFGLSPADEAALEHGLRICDAWSGRLLAVAAGPETIEPVLRRAAAVGASVLRVPDIHHGIEHGDARELAADEHELARKLVAALHPWGRPSVVVYADRSVDRGTGALPAFVAHELGAAQALGLVALEVAGAPGDGDLALSADRRLDGGWREQLRVPVPAVCSVEAAGVRLRRASLTGALAAEAMAVPVSGPSPEPVGDEDATGRVRVGPARPFAPRTRVLPAPEGNDPRLRLLALTGALVSHDPPTVVGPMGSGDAADELIGFLVRHGYLDGPPDAGRVPGESRP